MHLLCDAIVLSLHFPLASCSRYSIQTNGFGSCMFSCVSLLCVCVCARLTACLKFWSALLLLGFFGIDAWSFLHELRDCYCDIWRFFLFFHVMVFCALGSASCSASDVPCSRRTKCRSSPQMQVLLLRWKNWDATRRKLSSPNPHMQRCLRIVTQRLIFSANRVANTVVTRQFLSHSTTLARIANACYHGNGFLGFLVNGASTCVLQHRTWCTSVEQYFDLVWIESFEWNARL